MALGASTKMSSPSGRGVLITAELMSQEVTFHSAMMAIINMDLKDDEAGVAAKVSDVTYWL